MRASSLVILILLMCCTACAVTSAPLAAQTQAVTPPAAAATPPRPCEAGLRFREFDFWVGSWKVSDAQGAAQGVNHISRQENGCFLLEKWTGAQGGTGTSINFYDPGRDSWIQQWVSSGGLFINIAGGVNAAGSMVMNGTIYYTTTKTLADFRAIWTPLDDGRVRQFFEQSNDGGKTWAPWFEGFYARSSD